MNQDHFLLYPPQISWDIEAAHLVNFLGSDTVAALLCTKKYYHAKLLGIGYIIQSYW